MLTRTKRRARERERDRDGRTRHSRRAPLPVCERSRESYRGLGDRESDKVMQRAVAGTLLICREKFRTTEFRPLAECEILITTATACS